MKPVKIRKNRNIIKILLAVLLIVVLIIVLNFFKKEIRNSFYLITAPAQKFFWKIGKESSNFLTSIIRTGSLKKELNKLATENSQLLAENSALKEVKNENNVLRQALGLELQKEFKLVIAEVISKDAFGDIILINKGKEAGIEKDMPVITPQKTIIGRIMEVYKNFSKVMLISDKKSSFDAKIQEKEIPGLLKGTGNLKIIFDLVPRDKQISEGDTIVTTNLGGIFPAGILVGKISNVKKNDIDPFQQIEVKPAFDINEINLLFIIIK